MNDIESFLVEILGDYKKKFTKKNGKYSYVTSYSKPIWSEPTIDMVIISPLVFEVSLNRYVVNNERCFYFLIYDNETDIIIGDIVRIHLDYDWKEEMSFFIYTAEERISEYTCPECGFWLVERLNKHSHKFVGCCDYPECKFSKEVMN